jgi:putative nucleotidyltransferase with HDIG domain
MLPVILEQLSDLLEAKGVAITIVEPLSGESLIELATGTWEGIVGERIEAGKGITAMILRTGEIYINNDVQGNPDARESHPRETMLQAAIAAVPLIAQDEVLGVLWIGSDKPFGGEEIRLLKATSNIAANAIRRATLHEQTEQRMLRLSVLHEIDKAIMANLSLTNILDVLLNQLKLFPEVNAASISLMDSNSLLKPTRAYGLTERAQTFISQKQDSDHPMLKAIQSRDIVEILGAPEIKRAREEVVPLRGIEFCSYLAVPLIARNNAVGVLEIFREERNLVDEEWHDFMLTLASQAAIAIHSARLIDDLKSANVELEVAYSATLEGWVHALDLRDKETEGHTLRVTEMTVELSRAMGVPEEMLVHIRRGALLHDIGKMAIPDSILLKPGPLSPDEWLIVRQHPVYAANWLAPISYLQPAIDIPRSHHERWDGSGYPEGLKGTDIPLAARIFAVVDVFDALSSDRPYRPAWPQEEILSHIRNESGKHFDPEVVEAFVRLFGNQPEQEASG